MIFPPGEFVVGANLPWIRYGIDFGANSWRAHGGIAQEDSRDLLDTRLLQLSAAGVTLVRWFLLCDGRAGIRFSAEGSPEGLDEHVFADMDAALHAARRHGVRVMFVLLDFHWCRPGEWLNGVQISGRLHALDHPTARRALLDKVFRPILARYRNDEAILAWDIINEPEWVTRGLGTSMLSTGLTQTSLRDFIADSAALIHEITTQPVTVGSAGTRWRSFYRGLPLDFDQVHWYETLRRTPPLETPVAELGFERPVLLGEFPAVASGRSVEDILEAARTAGYVGAFHWPSENM